MSAAQRIQIMDRRRIVSLICSLDAAFCHHGVGVTHLQLGDHQHAGAAFFSFQGCAGSRTAAADNQHIHIVIQTLQVQLYFFQTAVTFQQCA